MRVLYHVPIAAEKMAERFPDLDHVAIPTDGALDAALESTVLLTYPPTAANLAAVLDGGIEWVQTMSAGVDNLDLSLFDGQVLTCSRGASAGPISEWCLAVMLAAAKALPQNWITEPPHDWLRPSHELHSLEGANVAVVGFGGIGQATANLALAFGMNVVAVRRTGAPSPIEAVRIASNLTDAFADADHIVLAAPATPATERLIDAAAFAAMKPGVHLINIARGSLVDQDALRVALDDGTVALASLDCVDPEPLPDGHWLFEHPKVRVSNHISWSAPGALRRMLDDFVDNLQRYVDGEPLHGIVDIDAGY